MNVAILDYGAGNLHSLAKALGAAPGVTVTIEDEPESATAADVLVLPGVGAFGMAARCLTPARAALRRAIRNGLPVLGICLGMQLLFERSDEATGDEEGLGVLSGTVTRLSARRVPQIGWNSLEDRNDPLLVGDSLSIAYFANGYACRPAELGIVRAWSSHDGDRFPAMVRLGSVVGVQFHPEKSSTPGVRFLHQFLAEVSP
jgi:glutamine amidotransferase